jgi:hypothetical protein
MLKQYVPRIAKNERSGAELFVHYMRVQNAVEVYEEHVSAAVARCRDV